MSDLDTRHAVVRRQHRGLTSDLVEFILDYGHAEQGSGATWYSIREDELPSYLRGSPLVEKSRNWTLMLDEKEGRVVTLYARPDITRHIRKKCHKRRQWMKNFKSQPQDDESTWRSQNATTRQDKWMQ